MGKIRKDIIEAVLERADIVEVVGDFLSLRKRGSRYLALCPFHEDHHLGNFVVYPKGGCYKCFACDAKGGVVDFLMNYAKLSYPDALRYLGQKYNIEIDNKDMDYVLPPAPPARPALPMLRLPMEMVTSREHTETNNLCCWLRSLPWDDSQRARLENVLTDYHVGHSRQGMTIFWQIDEECAVRTGKMMLYKPDGHRDRDARYGVDWIHATLFRSKYKYMCEDNYDVKPTLFGMHLLGRWPKAAVNIVESEKTALIMATAYGNNIQSIWMACGGVEMLTREKLSPIIREGRRIVVYPDRDAVTKWREKVNGIHYDRLTVNVQAVNDWWKPVDGDKADIADVVLRMMTEHTTPPAVTVGEMMKKNPAVRSLVEKFNLEIEDGKEEGA